MRSFPYSVLKMTGAIIAIAMVAVSCDSTGPTSQGAPPVGVIKPGQIVFVDQSGPRYSISVADSNGARLENLSPGGSTDMDPAVSSDGKKIAFTSAAPFDTGDIWVMNANGTNRVRLTHAANSVSRNGSPAWSPDGKRIAFVASTGIWVHHIFVMNADGNDVKQLTYDDEAYNLSPEWSPDGSRILFAHFALHAENTGIFEMDPDGSNVRQLTSGSGTSAPTRAPDGAHIAFLGGESLFVVDADGRNVRVVTTGVYWDGEITWSPDSKSIVFGTASNSKMCFDWDYEEYACGRDLKRVGIDGTIFSAWEVTSAFSASWQR